MLPAGAPLQIRPPRPPDGQACRAARRRLTRRGRGPAHGLSQARRWNAWRRPRRAGPARADVASQRGNTDNALSLYREAMAGTAEAIRRKPDDPQRLYEHAQNVFYVGEIAYSRGQLDEAAARFMEYKQLADRMVALDPNNIKWRIEVENGLANLGAVRFAQRRYSESAALSEQ